MKKFILICLALYSGLYCQKCVAQEPFATLKKNVNVRANTLVHELNATKDTLILKGSKKISYVYSINKEYKREIDTYIFKNEHKLPLNTLSEGKHVFVVGQMGMKIVFVIYINQPSLLLATKAEKLVTSNKE